MSEQVTLGVLSDTHLMGRPVPERVLRALDGVDMILHAGDILEMAILDELESIAPTVAVAGNMDGGELREVLPDKRVIEAGGYRIGLIHGWGAPDNMTSRLRREFEDVDIVVFGHTHEACNREEDGVYFFNPGSPTDKIFASFRSLGILELGECIRGRIVMLE
jgi:uncharacterized protein